jgi:hypothetical protein
MAHFRAVIKGQRGEASRLGSKNSGISTLLQTWGWDVAVRADYLNPDNDDALIELVNHTTGQRIPLLGLNLAVKDYADVVTWIYRTVDEKTSAAKLAV